MLECIVVEQPGLENVGVKLKTFQFIVSQVTLTFHEILLPPGDVCELFHCLPISITSSVLVPLCKNIYFCCQCPLSMFCYNV